MRRPDCFSMATRGFPKRCGTGTWRISRRASAWSGIRTAMAAIRFASAASILYDVAETWFNERETTNAPIGTSDRYAQPGGWIVQSVAGLSGRQSVSAERQGLLPHRGYLREYADRSEAHVRGALEYHLSAAIARQLAGSISYLGNKTTHLWSGNGEVNPASFLGLGPCTINGVTYPTCSTTGNTNQRRRLYLANPGLGAGYASINTSR